MRVINALNDIMHGFDFSYLLGLVQRIIPALICITLHELSHGLAAYKLGDDTAKRMGRLTLNPVKHLDFMGLAMMIAFRFGWAKPVPVNMYRFKEPKRGMAITALAGPAANVLITVVALLLYGLLYIPLFKSRVGGFFLDMIIDTAYMSLGLGIFNLIPISPLDGSKILFSVLDDEKYSKLMRYEEYGSIILFALVAAGVISRPLSAAVSFSFEKLSIIAQGSYDLVFNLFYK